jgi:hypothetical protein
MVQASGPALPQTLEAFIDWEPTDGFKYEWNDGEIVRFSGMQKKQYFIYGTLSRLS